MKKLLMVGVSLMIILSLVACSKKEDDKKDDNNTPGIEDNVDKDNQESDNNNEGDKTDDENKDESNNDDSNKDESSKDESVSNGNQNSNQQVKPEVKPETKPEAKPDTKPDTKPEATTKSLSEIISNNRDKASNDAFGIVTKKDDKDAELTFAMLEIEEADMAEYAISLSPINTKAYCVAIVKPAKDKKDAVKKAFESYKSNQETIFEQYLQDQYKIAQDAVITEVGDYIVFVMCEDSSTLRDNIVSALK